MTADHTTKGVRRHKTAMSLDWVALLGFFFERTFQSPKAKIGSQEYAEYTRQL